MYSQTCLLWPPKGNRESGLSRTGSTTYISLSWPLYTGGLYNREVTINTGSTSLVKRR